MIHVEAKEGSISLTIPTEGMGAEEVDDFVNWLRAENVARRSKLTEAGAAELADEVKQGWWGENKGRFDSTLS